MIRELMSKMTDPETRYSGLGFEVNTDSNDYKRIFEYCKQRGYV